MAYVGVLLLVALNCLVFFFVSVLAVPGDGSADGVGTVRLFGYVWIAASTGAALILCARGKRGAGILTAVSALPTAYVAAVLSPLAVTCSRISSRTRRSSGRRASLRIHFAAAPATPVQSIAYDGARDDTVRRVQLL